MSHRSVSTEVLYNVRRTRVAAEKRASSLRGALIDALKVLGVTLGTTAAALGAVAAMFAR